MELEDIVKKYAEENNIKGYLTCKDSEEIKRIMLLHDNADEYNNDMDDDMLITRAFQAIDMYNYLKEKENEDIPRIIERIEGCDFTIMRDKDGTISLEDLQGGYLGGYESYQGFETIMDANDRIEHFYDDYYFDVI